VIVLDRIEHNILIFDLIARVDTLHTIVEQLVEDETYMRTTAHLIQREVVGVTVNDCSEVICEER
jgi:hypothetical protein